MVSQKWQSITTAMERCPGRPESSGRQAGFGISQTLGIKAEFV